MRNSLVIALVALGVVASVHADDGRGEGGRGNGERADHRVLEVFDGKGRAIGPVVSYAPLGTILNVNGISIFAPIQHATTKVATQFSASQFQWATYFFAYLTTDCSGSPLITASSASSALLRPAQLVREGADVTAYIAGDTYPAQTSFKSYRSGGARVVGTETLEAWTSENSYPVTQHYPRAVSVTLDAGRVWHYPAIPRGADLGSP